MRVRCGKHKAPACQPAHAAWQTHKLAIKAASHCPPGASSSNRASKLLHKAVCCHNPTCAYCHLQEQIQQEYAAAITKRLRCTLHLLHGWPTSLQTRQLVIAHLEPAAATESVKLCTKLSAVKRVLAVICRSKSCKSMRQQSPSACRSRCTCCVADPTACKPGSLSLPTSSQQQQRA